MLDWIIHKDKPKGWRGEHILACYLYGDSKLDKPLDDFIAKFEKCDLDKD